MDQELYTELWAGSRRRQMLHVHSPDGSTFLREMTSWPPSWEYDVISEIRLCRSMLICLKKSRQISLWFDLKQRSLTRLFWRWSPLTIIRTTTRWVAIWDRFLIQKAFPKVTYNKDTITEWYMEQSLCDTTVWMFERLTCWPRNSASLNQF